MFPSRESNRTATCITEFGTTFLMSQAIRFIQCPAPLMKNTRADLTSLAANEGVHSKFCVMPCPSFVYSDAENKIMWFSYVVPGTIALLVNFVATVFMATNKREWNQTLDVNTRFLILVALFSGLIGTLPSLALFSDLPCGCGTEDCFDTTALCTLNRLNIPLLQTIMFALSFKLVKLHASLTRVGPETRGDSLIGESGCVIVAGILCMVSFVLEDRTYGSDQYSFHISRSAFQCKIRLPSFQAEFLLMHLPIVVAGVIIIYYLTRVITFVTKTVNRVRNAPSPASKYTAQNGTVNKTESGGFSFPMRAAKNFFKNRLVYSTSLLCLFSLMVLLLWSVSSILTAPQFASAQSDFDDWYNNCYKVSHL